MRRLPGLPARRLPPRLRKTVLAPDSSTALAPVMGRNHSRGARNSVTELSLEEPISLISLGLSLAMTLMAAAFFPAPAHAQDGITPLKATLPVQFIATLICAPGDASCSTCKPLFVQVLKCYKPYDGQFGTYSGTLTATAPNGKDSLTWAYAGKNDNAGDFYGFGPFSGTLTITGGTGKFEGARGGATFTAASGPSLTAGPTPVQVAGTAFYYVQGRLGPTRDK